MARCTKCNAWRFSFMLENGLCRNCCRESAVADSSPIREAVASPVIQETVTVVEETRAPEVPVTPIPVTPKKKEQKKYKVTGMSHYMDNLMSLSYEDQDYFLTKKELIEENYVGERVWRYGFDSVRVELVPEPDNPADPKAIKVLVKDVHVGYIKAGSCAHLLKVLREDRIKKIECEIFGGPYKYIDEEYDYERDKEIYTLEKGDAPYAVHLTIEEE